MLQYLQIILQGGAQKTYLYSNENKNDQKVLVIQKLITFLILMAYMIS